MTEEKERHNTQTDQQQAQNKDTDNPTKDLFFKILNDGGATCEELGDNRYGFIYKKEHFVVMIDDSVIIRIVDYNWHSVSRWDAETITKLQSKINHFNMYAIPKMVYAYDDDDDTFNISTIVTVPLTKEIGEINAYFVAMLDRMMHAHEYINDKPDDEDSTEQKEEGGEEND